MENNTFKVINEEGREIVCDILFTFDSEDTGKAYRAWGRHGRGSSGVDACGGSLWTWGHGGKHRDI